MPGNTALSGGDCGAARHASIARARPRARARMGLRACSDVDPLLKSSSISTYPLILHADQPLAWTQPTGKERPKREALALAPPARLAF